MVLPLSRNSITTSPRCTKVPTLGTFFTRPACGATNVPCPTCAVRIPSARSSSYAWLTVFRLSPSAVASSRVAGSFPPRGRRSATMRLRR